MLFMLPSVLMEFYRNYSRKRPMKIYSALLFLILVPLQNAAAQLISISQSDFPSTATVLGFDNTTALSNIPGLTFVNEDGFFGVVSSSEPFGNRNALINTTTTSEFLDLAVEFANPVQAFGGSFGRIPNFLDQHVLDLDIRALDSNSNVIGMTSISLPQQFDSPVWAGFQSATPISRVEFLANDTGFFGVVEFTFGDAVVPEPSSLPFVVVGLAFLTSIRRRS